MYSCLFCCCLSIFLILQQQKIKQLALIISVHIITIVVECIIVFYCRRNYGASYATLAITYLNSVTPYLCGYLIYYESHAYEGAFQTSLYVKVTISLWTHTAIVTAIVTPFTETNSNDDTGIIHSLFAIYTFEISRGPVMQLIDAYGHMQRRFFAPRAPDQRRTNLLFQGTYWQLSERYTSMTNILFLTFFYSSIFHQTRSCDRRNPQPHPTPRIRENHTDPKHCCPCLASPPLIAPFAGHW